MERQRELPWRRELFFAALDRQPTSGAPARPPDRARCSARAHRLRPPRGQVIPFRPPRPARRPPPPDVSRPSRYRLQRDLCRHERAACLPWALSSMPTPGPCASGLRTVSLSAVRKIAAFLTGYQIPLITRKAKSMRLQPSGGLVIIYVGRR